MVQSQSTLRKGMREVLDKLNDALTLSDKERWLEILRIMKEEPPKEEKENRKKWRKTWKSKWIALARSMTCEPKKAETNVILFVGEEIIRFVVLKLIPGYKREAVRKELRNEALSKIHMVMPWLIVAGDPVSRINRIVKNMCIDFIRKDSRRKKIEVKKEGVILAVMPERPMIDIYKLVRDLCERWAKKLYADDKTRIEFEVECLYVTFKMLVKKYNKKYKCKKINNIWIARLLARLHLLETANGKKVAGFKKQLEEILKCEEILKWLEMPSHEPFVANALPEPVGLSILDSNPRVDSAMQINAKVYDLISTDTCSEEGI